MNSQYMPAGRGTIRINDLHHRYARRDWSVTDCMRQVLERMAAVDRQEIWISRVSETALLQRAAELDRLLAQEGEAALSRLPLFGIPFAVKDNIDVAGMPTTAACPDFAYTPDRSATVVERLQAAGAVLIGKTNLDQFATGLVGTRSPYGAVRNAAHPDYVSGGSSSGSAVAVALGIVGFSLGTDTAGSGRVPAGLNGIVGLKPTRGLISSRGVFPACRTLDCVSIFAGSTADAWHVLRSAAAYDAQDAYSRRLPMLGASRRQYRVAIPEALEFFQDGVAEAAFHSAVEALGRRPDVEIVRIEFTPFREAAALLYQGPWVSERLAAVGSFFDERRGSMHPVVAEIIGQGSRYSAVDAFNGQYRLAALRRQAEDALRVCDLLLVPTVPTMPRIDAVLADPVRLNAQLGYYTNFVNFFDMSALSVPAAPRSDGLPAGVTLIGPMGADHLLAKAAQCLFEGGDESSLSDSVRDVAAVPLSFDEPTVEIAVVGAHLEGQPLNWQLVERGARKLARTLTAPRYRLYALPGTTPPKPGLARAQGNGTAIEIEIWEMPTRRFGEFVAEVPAPLGIGSVETSDGRWVKGFICEPCAIEGAEEISAHGGWRAYLASQAPSNLQRQMHSDSADAGQ